MLIIQSDISTNNKGYVIQDAYNICINQTINGIFTLTFDLPINSKTVERLTPLNYVKCTNYNNQYFILSNLKRDKKTNTINCEYLHLISTASNVFIPIYPIMIGKTAKQILEKGITNTKFSLCTDEELEALGMEWIDGATDIINGFDCINLTELISKTLELYNQGELYVDNYKFAIVKRIGKTLPLICTPETNIEDLSDSIDYTRIMNVITVTGANGMPLDSTYENSQIRSEESITAYGEKQGYLTYSNVDNKEELERRALWEISEDNPDRIDMPTYNLTVKLVDLYKINNLDFYKINLGDEITIKDNLLNINKKQRIISIKYYPYQNTLTTLQLGNPAYTLSQMIAKLEATRETLSKNTLSNDKIAASGLSYLTPFLQPFKNMVYNSSFEIYDEYKIPKYWITDNMVTSDSTRFGSVSLCLLPNTEVRQSDDAMINYTWYESESDKTIISFFQKGGKTRITVYNENGDEVPHKSYLDENYVYYTDFQQKENWKQQNYITINNADIGTDKFRISFFNMDSINAYIDGVSCYPLMANNLPLYIDGPHSEANDTGDDIQAIETLKYGLNDNKEVKTIIAGTEIKLAEISLVYNDNTQIMLNAYTILNETTSNKNVELIIKINETAKYTFPYCVLNGKTTIDINFNMKKLQAGSYIVSLYLKNNGTEDITIEKENANLSLLAKSAKMEEVPDIPYINVIQVFKPITFNINNEFAVENMTDGNIDITTKETDESLVENQLNITITQKAIIVNLTDTANVYIEE